MVWDDSDKSYNPVFNVLIRMWPYWQYLFVAIKQEKSPDWQQPCCYEALVCRWIANEKKRNGMQPFLCLFKKNHCSEGNICISNKDSLFAHLALACCVWPHTWMTERVAAPLQLSAVTWAPSFTSHHSWELHRKKHEEASAESHMSDKVVPIHLNSCSCLYSWFNLQKTAGEVSAFYDVWWYYSLTLSVD